jgi:Ribonuclease D
MRITHERMGDIRWTQYMVDRPDDIHVFRDWVDRMAQRGTPVGVDTETTGLNVFLPAHRLRLIQFGTPDEAWLLPVEYGEAFVHAARTRSARCRS